MKGSGIWEWIYVWVLLVQSEAVLGVVRMDDMNYSEALRTKKGADMYAAQDIAVDPIYIYSKMKPLLLSRYYTYTWEIATCWLPTLFSGQVSRQKRTWSHSPSCLLEHLQIVSSVIVSHR